jgi:hypothetical protein
MQHEWSRGPGQLQKAESGLSKVKRIGAYPFEPSEAMFPAKAGAQDVQKLALL